jgi:hypothetical protein
MKPAVQKAIVALTTVLFFASPSYSQTNTFPTTGNVGIGTGSAPTAKLQVNGSARIDSMLVVKDSIVVNKTATIKSDLKVVGNTILKSDLKVGGQTTLVGTTVIKEGDLKIKSLGDSTLPGDGVLVINAAGKVKNGGDLKSLVYTQVPAAMPCASDMNGGYIQTAPFWQASANPQRMFLINTSCSPDPRLGVGVKPDAKLHVRLDLNPADQVLHPLIIDKKMSNVPGVEPYKLLQLDRNGLLYAREVKVNLDTWSDYVFDEKYPLMPLSELQQFIRENNHLPNIPSAEEMTQNGLNVAQSSIFFMEKIEELTLYVLQINEQLKVQKELLDQQQEAIRLQQELIRKLEEKVKP